MLRRVPPSEACGVTTGFGPWGSTAIGSFEFGCKRFGSKVLQENHPCGPGHIFAGILIFSHLLLSHGWRPDPCGLLRTPERRIFRRMGNRVCGTARSLSKCFVSAVRQAKVPPCLRRSACPPQGFWRRGYAQAGTGFLRRPHWPVRLSFFDP